MKKRQLNPYKASTDGQANVRKRYFSMYRLRGMIASLKNIDSNGGLKSDGCNVALYKARIIIQQALRLETGK